MRKLHPRPAALVPTFDSFERVRGSADRDFRLAFAESLSRLSDLFGVLPGFSFFDDSANRNAFASPEPLLGKEASTRDGTVGLGDRLFRDLMRNPEYPEIGVLAVCAHEFGHIVQYKYGISKEFSGDPTVRRKELQADFLAGYFAGVRKLERSAFPASKVAQTMYDFGNDRAQDRNDPDDHGSKWDRSEAVQRGFFAAYKKQLPFEKAMVMSVAEVASI